MFLEQKCTASLHENENSYSTAVNNVTQQMSIRKCLHWETNKMEHAMVFSYLFIFNVIQEQAQRNPNDIDKYLIWIKIMLG